MTATVVRTVRNTIEVHAKWRRHPGDPRPRRKVLHARRTGTRDGQPVYTVRSPAIRALVVSLKAKLPEGAICDVTWPGDDDAQG